MLADNAKVQNLLEARHPVGASQITYNLGRVLNSVFKEDTHCSDPLGNIQSCQQSWRWVVNVWGAGGILRQESKRTTNLV